MVGWLNTSGGKYELAGNPIWRELRQTVACRGDTTMRTVFGCGGVSGEYDSIQRYWHDWKRRKARSSHATPRSWALFGLGVGCRCDCVHNRLGTESVCVGIKLSETLHVRYRYFLNTAPLKSQQHSVTVYTGVCWNSRRPTIG